MVATRHRLEPRLSALERGHAAPPRGVPLRSRRHPGALLQKWFLTPAQISQVEAARLLGISRRRLHEIVQGQRAVSPDTAIRLAMVFGLQADVWLRLQSEYDSWHAWRRTRAGFASSQHS